MRRIKMTHIRPEEINLVFDKRGGITAHHGFRLLQRFKIIGNEVYLLVENTRTNKTRVELILMPCEVQLEWLGTKKLKVIPVMEETQSDALAA